MHQRHSIRLHDYDYTHEGAYFVTICVYKRISLFGEIVDGEMHLNTWGETVQACWDEISSHHSRVELDAFVIMPNHVNGVLMIADNPKNTGVSGSRGMIYHAPTEKRAFSKPVANSLSTVVGSFKAAVTRQIHRIDASNDPIWQRNYYEHIIRSQKSLDYIRAYCATNPERWLDDSLYTVDTP